MTHTVDIDEMLEKITTFNQQFLKVKREILEEQNVNASAINLISIIGNEKITLKDITEVSDLDKSTISRQLKILVRDELVSKEPGEDKRFSFFELSESAKMIYQEYLKSFTKYLEDALKGWTEEEKQMFSVLIGRANYSLSTALIKK